jgi:hypothetical protein
VPSNLLLAGTEREIVRPVGYQRIERANPLVGGVSWKSRVIGFGHAEQDIGDADRAEYR